MIVHWLAAARNTCAGSAVLKAALAKNHPTLCAPIMCTTVHQCHNDAAGTKRAGEGHGDQGEPGGKASEEKLREIEKLMAEHVPHFFTSGHCFKVYSKNVIFEDNIRNVRFTGLGPYMAYLSMLRVFGHLRYNHVKMHVLSVYTDLHDSSVKIRWQVQGSQSLRLLLNFWKLRAWSWKELTKTKPLVDGFSTLYVASNGEVWKHVADRMMPDDERFAAVAAKQDGLRSKLTAALSVGCKDEVAPREPF